MGYRRALLSRWSRRDRLTVLVVAVTAAFLLGTALLLFSTASFTTAFAEELDRSTVVDYHDDPDRARQVASDDARVFPTAEVTRAGEPTRIIGVPPNASTWSDDAVSWQTARLPQIPADGAVRGPVGSTRQTEFAGDTSTRTLRVVPHAERTVFPDHWYAANASTVDTLGATGAFVVEPRPSATTGFANVPAVGVPLVSALLFVLAGLQQVLWAVAIATAAGGLLILVVVYSVTRMSVRDRLDAIRVIRSTGGTRVGILSLFALRAGLLVTTGVALGYAIGLITAKTVVNAAVYVGVPIAIDVTVTGQSGTVLLALAGVLVGSGVLAGALAAYPAAVTSPARLGHRRTTPEGRQPTDARSWPARLRPAVTPTLLSWRSLVPTATTLAVFGLTVLLVSSLAGVASPLGGSGGDAGTITEAGAAHPLNSRLDAEYATALRAGGTPASPEIIYAQVHDGDPYMAHGADFAAFANVTGASVVDGHAPTGLDEAVIGADLARTLGVDPGDDVTLGGSISPAIRRVTVVGTFAAEGTLDDILVVPLETARESSMRDGQVHLIRVAGDVAGATEPGPQANRTGVVVTGVSGPATVAHNASFNATVSLRNFGDRTQTHQFSVRYGNATRTRTVSVPAGSETTTQVQFDATRPGDQTITVSDYTHHLTVYRPGALTIPAALPDRAPPGAGLYVPVVTRAGDPVANATVEIDGFSARTQSNGAAVVPLPTSEGNYTITASTEDRASAPHQIRIVEGAPREFAGALSVSPQSGNVLTRPTVTVTLGNPWQRPGTRTLSLVGPGDTRTRTVELGPGNFSRADYQLGSSGSEFQPGTYTLRFVANGTTLATTEYTVHGDDRLASAVASSGAYASGTTIERSIEGVFGNVQLLLVALIVLAALSTVGSTTATFAQAVHDRRQAIGIHRSTGASQLAILRTVLADVVRIAVPATVLGVVLAVVGIRVLAAADLLVFFGIRLSGSFDPLVLGGLVAGSLGLALFGATVAMVPYLRASPVSLLPAGDRVATPERSDDATPDGGTGRTDYRRDTR